MKTQKALSNSQYIISTLAIEGLTPSEFALDLCKKMDSGEYKIDEAIAAVLERHGLQRRAKNG